MGWLSYFLQAIGGVSIIVLAAAGIAKYLLNLWIERDHILYQARMDEVLEELRNRSPRNCLFTSFSSRRSFRCT